jgi:hypothetical protein
MSKLLGETVRDTVSGELAEAIGYDSKLAQYKIVFQDGRSSYRYWHELAVLRDKQWLN